jgi:hypothetical protein
MLQLCFSYFHYNINSLNNGVITVVSLSYISFHWPEEEDCIWLIIFSLFLQGLYSNEAWYIPL